MVMFGAILLPWVLSELYLIHHSPHSRLAAARVDVRMVGIACWPFLGLGACVLAAATPRFKLNAGYTAGRPSPLTPPGARERTGAWRAVRKLSYVITVSLFTYGLVEVSHVSVSVSACLVWEQQLCSSVENCALVLHACACIPSVAAISASSLRLTRWQHALSMSSHGLQECAVYAHVHCMLHMHSLVVVCCCCHRCCSAVWS